MYKIVEIHKADAFYDDRKQIIGLVGNFEKSKWQTGVPEGFVAGDFVSSKKINSYSKECYDELSFFAVKVEEVE